jgi:hypothetical protein
MTIAPDGISTGRQNGEVKKFDEAIPLGGGDDFGDHVGGTGARVSTVGLQILNQRCYGCQ